MKKTILFIIIFAFAGCAGKTPAPELAELNKKIKSLNARVEKNNHNIMGPIMELKVQGEWNAEVVGWIKHLAKQNENLRFELFEVKAGHAQLDKDIKDLEKRLQKKNPKKKKRNKKPR